MAICKTPTKPEPLLPLLAQIAACFLSRGLRLP